MMKKCEFCDAQLMPLIEWDSDESFDKYTCPDCPFSTTFIYIGNGSHLAYEFWFVKERDADGITIRSYQFLIFLETDKDKLDYFIKIREWCQSKSPQIVYQTRINYKITPLNVERKLKEILTFM